MLDPHDVIDDIIDDVIHSLKSYINGHAEFFGTQHSLISMSIHWFVRGLCTDPQGVNHIDIDHIGYKTCGKL